MQAIITARVQAPPVTREQEEEALPPAERHRALKVAVGHSGDLLTITSHAAAYDVLPPQGDVGDGLGLRSISGGAVLTVSEISSAADSRAASFTVTVSVVGQNQRATVPLSVSIDPLQAPIMEPVRLAGEDTGGATVVNLKRGEFASATFARVSGDAGLSVKASTGEVVAAERAWADGGYHIVVNASGADADDFIGQVPFTVSLIVGFPAPVLFSYNRQDVRAVGDVARVAGMLDEDGANEREFSMTYRGARRGLHWMESADADSTSHQRALCRAGGGGWRVPTPAEIAGLLLDGAASAEIGASTPSENGAAAGALLSLAARVPADETLSGLSQGPFFADFLLNGSAALAEESGGKLNLSGQGGDGRYLCVLGGGEQLSNPPAPRRSPNGKRRQRPARRGRVFIPARTNRHRRRVSRFAFRLSFAPLRQGGRRRRVPASGGCGKGKLRRQRHSRPANPRTRRSRLGNPPAHWRREPSPSPSAQLPPWARPSRWKSPPSPSATADARFCRRTRCRGAKGLCIHMSSPDTAPHCGARFRRTRM